MQKPITIMSHTDYARYMSLIAELIERDELETGTCDYIVQLVGLDGVYIGAWIVVDSASIDVKPSGPEPEWRKWIWVSADWDAVVCDSIGDMYTLAKQHYPPAVFKRHGYLLSKHGRFELTGGMSTMDLSRWGGNSDIQ